MYPPDLTLKVSRAKWRPGHPDQIALAAGEKGMLVMSLNEPHVPLVAFEMGLHVKHGFVWMDTPFPIEETVAVSPRK